MNVMIVKKDNKDTFFHKIHDVPIYSYYDKETIIFKLSFKYNLPILKKYIKKWLNKVAQFETIILFDNGFCNALPKIIKKQNKTIKIILWFWNPITNTSNKFLDNKLIDEFWTYNLEDAKLYNINYNTQFYSRNVAKKINKIIYDVIYVGADKGRKEQILNYKKIFEQMNLKTKFIIVNKKEDYLNYDQYITLISKSKCIFEYIDNKIQALTLRAMESIFLEKKLITNNSNIKNYDFYNKKNIFILNYDTLNNIIEFLNTPYKKISQQIIDKYNFNQWLNRFEKNGEDNERK